MAFDTLGRRDRFNRNPVGKRLRLNNRDLQILRALYRYGYLYPAQLLPIVGAKSKKRLVERLGDLFHEAGLVTRTAISPDPFSSHGQPLLYALSSRGHRLLDELNQLPDRAFIISRRASPSGAPQWLHKLLVIETLMAVERSVAAFNDRRFVTVDEILRRAPAETPALPNPLRIPVTLVPTSRHPIIRRRMETHVIPDGLYGIEYAIDGANRYRFWALECERTSPETRSHAAASSTALKKAAYQALLQSGGFKKQWGIPNLKLHLVKSSSKGMSL